METNPHRALRPCWPLFWAHHMRWDIGPLNDGNSCCPTHEEPALSCTPGGQRSQSRMRNRSPRPGPTTPKPRAPATSHSKQGGHCFLGLQTRVSGFKSLQLTPFSGRTLQLPSAPQRGSLPTPASSPGKFLGFTATPYFPLSPHTAIMVLKQITRVWPGPPSFVSSFPPSLHCPVSPRKTEHLLIPWPALLPASLPLCLPA